MGRRQGHVSCYADEGRTPFDEEAIPTPGSVLSAMHICG